MDADTRLLTIHTLELAIEKLYSQDAMRALVHRSLDPEVVLVGVCAQLRADED